MSAFFYCIYHCFLSILRKYGYESRNQGCTLAVIQILHEEGKIRIDSKFIDALNITKIKEIDHSVIKMREDFQYGVDMEFTRIDDFKTFLQMCRELIDATRRIIHS